MKDNLQLVVTLYNQVTPITPLPDNTIFYDKRDSLTDTFTITDNVIRVPNYGKDAYTIPHYISTFYDNLPDYVLFSQCDPYFHDPEFHVDKFKNKQFYGVCERRGNWCGSIHLPFHGWDRLIHHNKWLKEFESGELKPAKLTYGEYWDTYIKKPRPDPETMIWYHGIIFVVSKSKILQHPKEYYQALLSTFDCKNSEEIHYLERSIHYIFNEA